MPANTLNKLISNLSVREKELVLFLVSNGKYRFTPIEISKVLGVTNKTVINRLAALIDNGFVSAIKVNERIRSYELSLYTQSVEKQIVNVLQKENIVCDPRTESKDSVDFVIDSYTPENLLAQLLIEGYSGEELLNEFKKRYSKIKSGTDDILKELKETYKNSNFGEGIPYELVSESNDREYKKSIWDAAIGLQAVDGLKPSKYLRKLADENIAGKKTYEEIDEDLQKEYGTSKSRQQEADVVSLRIARMLEFTEFNMNVNFLLIIHSVLFEDVYEPDITGKFRKYNIGKREPILLGDSVYYTDHLSIKSQLTFILEDEKEYKYSKPITEEDIDHLSEFTRKIWQTHPFGEGNTRTTAVFIELYLKSLGYDVNNMPFRDNSDYYRNALVRSCYSSTEYKAKPTYEYLKRFYMNLLYGADNKLDSWDLFISNKTN